MAKWHLVCFLFFQEKEKLWQQNHLNQEVHREVQVENRDAALLVPDQLEVHLRALVVVDEAQ